MTQQQTRPRAEAASQTLPELTQETFDQLMGGPETPWQVLVWDDPVNLMSYVTYIFRSQFGYSQAKAHRLMLQVHEEGKAAVFSGSKEEAERHTQALQAAGLWATFERGE